jgi:hypothetical protein
MSAGITIATNPHGGFLNQIHLCTSLCISFCARHCALQASVALHERACRQGFAPDDMSAIIAFTKNFARITIGQRRCFSTHPARTKSIGSPVVGGKLEAVSLEVVIRSVLP